MDSMCLKRKTPAFSYVGNWKSKNKYGGRQICRRRHSLPVQPVTPTMHDMSLRILLKIYTEASSNNYHQTQKAMQSLKSAGVRRCQSRSAGSNCHPVELISDQTTENNSQEMAACLFSRKRRSREGMNKN